VRLCGASIARRDGSHQRCLLPGDHKGDCDPRIHNPRGLQTPELLRHSAAMLRDVAAQVAEELERRALLLERVRVKMSIANRRGWHLPQELVDILEVAIEQNVEVPS
jgi:hypothetical protein